MNKLINSNSFILKIIGITVGLINLLLISQFPGYLFVYFGLIFILIFVIQTNIIRIYVRYDEKYQSGNGYMRRMYLTVGIFNTVFYMLLMLIAYLVSIINLPIGILIMLVVICCPFEMVILNKFWITYDQNKYHQIDQANPNQKKYWNEPKEVYQARKKW